MRMVVACLACAALVPGCRNSPATQGPQAADGASVEFAEPLRLGPELPPASSGLELHVVYPFIAAHAAGVSGATGAPESASFSSFEVVEGSHAGKVLVLTQRALAEPGRYELVRSLQGREQPLERRVQRLEPDGTLMLEDMKNVERGVIVEFDPDPVTMPPRLEAGVPIAGTQKMRLPLISNPRKLRERGEGEMTLIYTGDQTVRSVFGEVRAARILEVYTSRLKNATAVRTIERWYAHPHGLIAERWEEVVTILGGVVVERSRHAMRRLQ